LAGAGQGKVAVADFNADGFLDLVSAAGVLLGKGDGTFGEAALFVAMSMESRDGPMWKKLDAIRDTFRCRRSTATTSSY
jgi:hypothetical protein